MTEFTGARDMVDAKAKLVEAFTRMEQHLLRQVDGISTSGMVDTRLLAIARADLEKGFAMLQRALMTGGSDGRQYAKVPTPVPFPDEFTPPTGDERRFTEPGERDDPHAAIGYRNPGPARSG
jgi:hypothetical protein